MFGNNTPKKTTTVSSASLYSSSRRDEDKTYNKLHIDENSDQVLRIAIQKCKDSPHSSLPGLFIRFAFLDWPNRDRQEFRCKVGLRAVDTPEAVEIAKKEYKEKNVIQATKQRAGVVHQQLIEKLNEVIGEDPSGGSFTIYVVNDTLHINPANRAARNSRVFSVNNIGQAIYLFGSEAKFDKVNHVFARFDRNLLYDLRRAQPQEPFIKLMKLFVEHVKTIATDLGIKNVVMDDSLLEQDCHSFSKERLFHTILNVMSEKEKINTLALMMHRNIYIAAGTESRFNPKLHSSNSQNKNRSGYEKEIRKIFEIVEKLKIKFDLNKVPEVFFYMSTVPALGMAAKNGYTELVELLLDNGASIDHPVNFKDATSLFLALGSNEIEVAKLLIARGADLFARTTDDRTLLHAVLNAEGAAILLAEAKKRNKKMDIDAHDLLNHRTPLYRAVWLKVTYKGLAKDAMELVKTLIEEKANPHIPDNKGITPLHLAVKSEDEELVQYLLQHVNLEINMKESILILQCAVDQKNTKMLKLLLTNPQFNLIQCEKILEDVSTRVRLRETYGFFNDSAKQEYALLREKSSLLREYIELRKAAQKNSSQNILESTM